MDPLDFAIYRSLSPDGEARFWGGRRLVDPLLPAREIAEKVGISENGVRARLRGLERRGFLRGKAVIPNPSLFDVGVVVAELPVQEVGEVERIYHDLALVEGVIFARDTLDEQDRIVRVHFVSDGITTTARRAALLRRLSPSGKVGAPTPYWIPPCSAELSPLDWRVLREIFLHPDESLAEVAHAVGIGPKTAAKRYHRLIESRACWWTHGPNSEELPLAFVRIELRDAAQRPAVTAALPSEAKDWMPVASDGFGLEPSSAAGIVAGLVPADAPAVLERTIRRIAGLPGVLTVRRSFALGSMAYPSWFSERVSARAAARA